MAALTLEELEPAVRKAVAEQPIVDLHTHLMPPSFDEMMLWGVDELLTYHYLVCEFFQTATDIRPDEFFALPKVRAPSSSPARPRCQRLRTPPSAAASAGSPPRCRCLLVAAWAAAAHPPLVVTAQDQQGDMIWDALFVKRSPISEQCRGVVTTLTDLGLSELVAARDIKAIRAWFAAQDPEAYTNLVLKLANIKCARSPAQARSHSAAAPVNPPPPHAASGG